MHFLQFFLGPLWMVMQIWLTAPSETFNILCLVFFRGPFLIHFFVPMVNDVQCGGGFFLSFVVHKMIDQLSALINPTQLRKKMDVVQKIQMTTAANKLCPWHIPTLVITTQCKWRLVSLILWLCSVQFESFSHNFWTSYRHLCPKFHLSLHYFLVL